MIVFVLVKVVFGLVSALAPNYPVLVTAQFLLGLGSAGTYVAQFSLGGCTRFTI